MAHIARKRFGQNFLTDASVIDSIVRAVDPRPGQALVEIGPGLGALTQPLLERLGRLTVIELDRDLATRLQARPGLSVLQADVLQVMLADLPGWLSGLGASPRWRVVGNLPYNISTPILFHLLSQVERVEDQHFMLQKEVVDRMVAAPSTAAYGRLSVMLQWRYTLESVLTVPPQAFEPTPQVNSAVVRMRPHAQPEKVSPKVLEELVRVAFSQRRKLLRHSLGPWLKQRGFCGDFDLSRRAQEVSVNDYINLAQALNPCVVSTPPLESQLGGA